MADLLVLLDFVFDDSNNNFDLAALVLPFAEDDDDDELMLNVLRCHLTY